MCGVNPVGVVGITMRRRVIPVTQGRQIFIIIQLSHQQGFWKKKPLSYLAHACEQYIGLLVEYWSTSCPHSFSLAWWSPLSAIICPESQLQLKFKIKITITILFGWKLNFLFALSLPTWYGLRAWDSRIETGLCEHVIPYFPFSY